MRSVHRVRRSWKERLLAAALSLAVAACASGGTKRSRESEAESHYRMGQVQFEQGKTLQAIESMRKALELNPDMAEARNYLGVIYLQQSDPKKAAEQFKEAVRIDPYFTDAHNHLGVAYKALKDYDKALKEFQTALNDKNYRTPEKIYLNMGHLHLERGHYAEAIRSFQRALSANPNYLLGTLGLGMAYQRSGQSDLARKELQKVVALGPGSPEAAEAQKLLDGQVKREGP